jgi:cell division protease FtsH
MKKNSSWRRWLLRIAGVIVLVLIALFFLGRDEDPESNAPIESFSALEKRVKDGKVEKLTWNPNDFTVEVTETDKEIEPYPIGVPAPSGSTDEGLNRLLELARGEDIEVASEPVASGQDSKMVALLRILPTLLIVALIVAALYFYGPFKRTKIESATTNVSFSDVAGCGEAIEELQDVRSFLADPKRYQRIGARVPKGVLLYGPPGTGKTLLAKAVANEAGIPFFPSSGSEFVEMYAGLGARRVRQLFEQAKKQAPSIIFIDELDAVGGHRSQSGGDGGTREADQTLIQILKEMDGFAVSEHPVIVMGATNRLEALDQALTRPGRFDRHISIDPPDKHGRHDILKVHAEDKRLADDVDLWQLAVQTSGMTGADLALLLNEAALLGARRRAEEISPLDIDDAYFRIIAGAKKQSRAMNEKERKTVAYHEAGHALVKELLEGSDKVHKISIIPRGRSGGQTVYVSEEDVFLHSERDLRDMLAALLAGRAAEELIQEEISSGAADDLQRASDLALKMVMQLGMGHVLGLRVAIKEVPLSAGLQAQIDQESKELLDKEYEHASELLEMHKETLIRIAEALLEEETIDRERFVELVQTEIEIDSGDEKLL